MFDLLKYTGLLSIPLFTCIAFAIIAQAPGHTWKKHSISETILFLQHSKLKVLFRLNFILKALIDSIFLWYIGQAYHVSYGSPIILGSGTAIAFFGLLAFVTVDTQKLLHVFLIYSVGVLMALSEICLAYLTRVQWFIVFTWIITVAPVCIAFWYLYLNKVSVLVQSVCIIMVYSWFVVFVFQFL
jgi:hypothetical protein